MYEKAGAIPFKRKNGKIKLLMITSIQKKNWIFPKGYIEPTQTPHETAAQEAWEEAGIIGEIIPDAYFEYQESKMGQQFTIKMLLFEVKEIKTKWEEASLRKREWFSIDEAKQKVNNDSLLNLIVKLESYFTGL